MKTNQFNSGVILLAIMIIISMSILLDKAHAQSAGNQLTKYNSTGSSNYNRLSNQAVASLNNSAIAVKDSVKNTPSLIQKWKLNSNQNSPEDTKSIIQSGKVANSKLFFSLKDKIFFIILSKY